MESSGGFCKGDVLPKSFLSQGCISDNDFNIEKTAASIACAWDNYPPRPSKSGQPARAEAILLWVFLVV